MKAMDNEDASANASEFVQMESTQSNELVPEFVQTDTHPNLRGFQKGFDPRRNAGGRPKKLRDIEKMLNTEHRDLNKMREVFSRLRSLALGEVIVIPMRKHGGALQLDENGDVMMEIKLEADARFMQLYLDRLMGPAKAFDDDMDLSDAPSVVLEYLRLKVTR